MEAVLNARRDLLWAAAHVRLFLAALRDVLDVPQIPQLFVKHAARAMLQSRTELAQPARLTALPAHLRRSVLPAPWDIRFRVDPAAYRL